MNFKSIGQYINFFSDQQPDYLVELERETNLKTTHAHMISGRFQGRVLSFLSKLLQPNSILEIGTFTGFSSLCMAEGLKNDGKIITIDHNDELGYFHDKYIKKSKWAENIQIKIGEAPDIINELDQTFDLIFIDADKENYPLYYEMLLPKLNNNSLLIVDNVLWYEKVLKKADDKDQATKAIQEFNRLVSENKDLTKIILPIRDGLSLIKKIK